MSKLSAIPRGIVIAMHLALISLVLLATVPLALGGLDVKMVGDPEVKYEDYSIKVSLTADVTTDLYFDITGFSCDVSVTFGGQTLDVPGEAVTISKKGSTRINVDVEIPLTSVLMMMLSSASYDDQDIILTVVIKGSTLGGMISTSVKVDTVIADGIVRDDILVNDPDHLKVKFTMPSGSGLLEDIFGSGPIAITIGEPGKEVTFTVNTYPRGADDPFVIILDMVSSAGSSLIADLEAVLVAGGDVTVTYGGNTYTFKLTEEQLRFIINMLKTLHERWK
jgi:hypothetical protein